MTAAQAPRLIDQVETLLQEVAAESCLCGAARATTGRKCKACEAIDLLQKFVHVRVR